MVAIPQKIEFCTIEELKKNTRVTKWIDEWRDELSAIFLDNQIVVLSTICPHFAGEFEEMPGTRKLRCKWHGWEFDIDSGKCLTYKIPGCLSHYPFSEKNGHLEVTLPEGSGP